MKGIASFFKNYFNLQRKGLVLGAKPRTQLGQARNVKLVFKSIKKIRAMRITFVTPSVKAQGLT